MSKFREEMARKLFEYLDKNLSKEIKEQLTPLLVAEIVFHSADFLAVQNLNSTFNQAIRLHRALLDSQEQEEEKQNKDDRDEFLDELKKL